MKNLIAGAVAYISSVLKSLQVKQLIAVAFVGVLLLTTNVALGNDSKSATREVDKIVHQNDSDRPKTTGEWNKEARETEGAGGERLKRIAKESKEAVKDFGSVYPDTAERSADSAQNKADKGGSPLSNLFSR
jgi:hypothetical protein